MPLDPVFIFQDVFTGATGPVMITMSCLMTCFQERVLFCMFVLQAGKYCRIR